MLLICCTETVVTTVIPLKFDWSNRKADTALFLLTQFCTFGPKFSVKLTQSQTSADYLCPTIGFPHLKNFVITPLHFTKRMDTL